MRVVEFDELKDRISKFGYERVTIFHGLEGKDGKRLYMDAKGSDKIELMLDHLGNTEAGQFTAYLRPKEGQNLTSAESLKFQVNTSAESFTLNGDIVSEPEGLQNMTYDQIYQQVLSDVEHKLVLQQKENEYARIKQQNEYLDNNLNKLAVLGSYLIKNLLGEEKSKKLNTVMNGTNETVENTQQTNQASEVSQEQLHAAMETIVEQLGVENVITIAEKLRNDSNLSGMIINMLT